METTKNLNIILSLLDASIIKRDNKFYIYDSHNSSMERIERKDNLYHFDIHREDGSYHFTYGYNGIIVIKDNETLTVSDKELVYSKKGKRFNTNYCMINSSLINFYVSDTNDEEHVEKGFKSFSDYSHIKSSSTVQTNGTVKEDITVDERDEMKVLAHTIRKYNSNGSLITSSLYTEDLLVPVEEYVKDQVTNSDVAKATFETLNSFIPGIEVLYVDKNPILKSVLGNKEKAI